MNKIFEGAEGGLLGRLPLDFGVNHTQPEASLRLPRPPAGAPVLASAADTSSGKVPNSMALVRAI